MRAERIALALQLTVGLLLIVCAASAAGETEECRSAGWKVSDQTTMRNFITRSGSSLMDGDRVVKFMSFNVPCMLFTSDYERYDYPIQFTGKFSNEWEEREAFAAIQQLGGQAIRTYVIPAGNTSYHLIYYDGTNPKSLRAQLYNTSTGQLTKGFDTLCRIIYLAEKYNIRLIIPFVDWWGYGFSGGLGHAAHEKTLPNILTDKAANEYFKKNVILPIMQLWNPYTNRFLKDEYSILAWESGNELGNPHTKMQILKKCGGDTDKYVEEKLYEWTEDMGKFLKEEVGIKQLFMDGTYGISGRALESKYIDIVSNHYYNSPCSNIKSMQADLAYLRQQSSRYKKPFFMGESMDKSLSGVTDFMDQVAAELGSSSSVASGFMFWSMRYRSYTENQRNLS